MKVLGIGNAIVDVICKVEESFIAKNNLTKGTMRLVNEIEFKKLLSTLKIKGYHSLLDEMGRSQTINPKTKALGNIILNFFSRSNATDEGSTIQIPLTIQDQWLSLGSFKVKKISSINW